MSNSAGTELASTLENSSLFTQRPELRQALAVAAVPERIIQFRVVWEDDEHNQRINNGFRVQYSSVLGPYKGGLRFHPSVNLSILKFLGFEQIFKNALTGLNMGGAKGGADFDPKGKSDAEIRRFCVAFMSELARHIGADTDVPAGDIGVSGREIGYLFGAYRSIRNRWEGVLTGKGADWGGSLIRPEATGYGLVYYVKHMIEYVTEGAESFAGKRVAISGSGNVAQYAALKVIELGGIVLSLSDSKGSVVAVDQKVGITAGQVNDIAALKESRKALADMFANDAESEELRYIPDERPWTHVGQVDVVLPSATQNEIDGSEAEALVAAGARYVAEGSNMGCTLDAIQVFEATRRSAAKSESGSTKATWYAPGKAANAGGVAVSGLEMAQNSQRLAWSAEQVDDQLQAVMHNCFKQCVDTAKQYVDDGPGAPLPSLVAGANIAGFTKVADAMFACGDVWVKESADDR